MLDAAMDVLPVTTAMKVHKVSVTLGKRRLCAEISVPKTIASDMPPLLALHGISRNAEGLAEAFTTQCAAKGQVLITPHFSKKHWRHFQRIGACRPDRSLLALLYLVQVMGLAATGRIEVFGYSGGAQLAHRFAMLYPQRIAALHVAAAGWYCLPDLTIPFPMGLAPSERPLKTDVPGLAHGQLRSYLGLPLRIYVGAKDTQRDASLRKDARLDSDQGRHRMARARSFFGAFRSAAIARGITPDLSMTELPDCAHSFKDCARAGLTTLVCNS